MRNHEALELRFAEKHDPGAGKFEPQVPGECRCENDIAYELRLNDQDRAERSG
ncbi:MULTISPECIES: hypothetical protein [unclassified Mesorhizobium]|uniref:hypothetical protein n=1 Tax=unclassified Mesorhizobium TaxID=325217 RepID=UPI001CCB733E|nr:MULTISPECIES: hypothetical protein [unclassified Mesorhizobium]MBZ9740945.1 hypothetical protein [Mesorhizobium sp. CO1-1-4]MBZ9804448.1 hypothetical protein [Mesorhizobium sp. ES1-6]